MYNQWVVKIHICVGIRLTVPTDTLTGVTLNSIFANTESSTLNSDGMVV